MKVLISGDSDVGRPLFSIYAKTITGRTLTLTVTSPCTFQALGLFSIERLRRLAEEALDTAAEEAPDTTNDETMWTHEYLERPGRGRHRRKLFLQGRLYRPARNHSRKLRQSRPQQGYFKRYSTYV